RLIVGISPSPHTTQVIRWARRTAYSLNASWIAVYVEGQSPLSEFAQKQLAENLRLARELGAEVVTTADTSADRGLLRIAAQEHATQILVGRSAHRAPFGRSTLLDRLMKSKTTLDIYVVGGEQETGQVRLILPRGAASWVQYAAAAVAVVAVSSASFPFRAFLGYQTVSLLLMLTITLLSLKLRAGPMLFAAALSALIWDYFFIPPLFTFQVALPVDVLMLCAYFIIAIVTGSLSARSRANENALRQREERASALFGLTRELSQARSVDGVVQAAVLSVKRHFNAEVVVLLGTAEGDFANTPHPASMMPMDEKEFAVAAWAYWNEKKAGRFTDTLPSARAVYYPLSGPRYSLGVIGIRQNTEKAMPLDQETLLQNFIDQIASALERESLSAVSAKAMVVAESERLYKTIFDSISHEIRTPLAAIAGSAEGLLNENLAGNGLVRKQFAREIHDAAGRLNRLVENLLDMTRLESGMLRPQLDWCDMRDIVNAATRRTASELEGKPVIVTVAPELPLLRLDFGLIEQALVNVLHNAALYSPPGTPIGIDAAVDGGDCLVTINDAGPGIPAGMEDRIFEKFFRLPGSRPGGTGLGLSIVKGFVEAHKGTIVARNHEGGGAQFLIRLPIIATPQAGVEHERIPTDSHH
ncbi:MAG TPA: ATP-binding protein, partial [Spirochaetia bacterium]|nr:ATP-binding protein [Spirochaetia bacterium]